MAKEQEQEQQEPPKKQHHQPGTQAEMTPQPQVIRSDYRGSGKLQGKVALITGGDSGIGQAVAVHFAKEGADVAIVYLDEAEDAAETKRLVEQAGQQCLTFPGDVGDEQFCQQVVQQTIESLGRLDVLVNNAAEQHPQSSIEDITIEQLERTFRTNIFGIFLMTKAAMPHLKEGAAIINTTSVTAYEGHPQLIDYSATKGAIVTFTRSLSQALVGKGIRVNGVAPGPIWTPLIPSTSPPDKVATFGQQVPMKRAGQPAEVAPSYVYLASADASYVSGQILHVNGGQVVNG